MASNRENRLNKFLNSDDRQTKNELGVLSQGQAEILGLQQEQENGVQMQRTQSQMRLNNMQVLQQASEGMLSMEEGGDQPQVVSAQVGNMNQSTQSIMQKYGIRPQNSRTSSSNSYRTHSGTGTMNVKNEYVTNNKTDVRITQPQIPMSQPQIVYSGKKSNTDNTTKFRAWMSQMFAKQQLDNEVQAKEFRKREWSIGRTTEKLMKRIEESSKNMYNRLNPENLVSTAGGQMKWLMLIFSATLFAKFFKPALKLIANIEGGLRSIFGWDIDPALQHNAKGGLDFVDKIKEKVFGLDPKKRDESLIKGIGLIVKEGFQKLIDKIDFWIQDRADAVREIKFPEFNIDLGSSGGLTGVILRALNPAVAQIGEAVKGLGQYFGDVLSAAIGGSKGKVVNAAKHVRKAAIKTMTTTGKDQDGVEVSIGDDALASGKERNYMRKSDYNFLGQLNSDAASTHAQASTVTRLINDSSSTDYSGEVATGVESVFDVARRKGSVVVTEPFLSSLGITKQDIENLRSAKQLRYDKYKVIRVKTTDSDLADNEIYMSHRWEEAALIADCLTGMKGWRGTSWIGKGLDWVDNIGLHEYDSTYRAKVVPLDSLEESEDGTPPQYITLPTLTKEGADTVAARFMHEAKDKSISLNNKEFMDRIRTITNKNNEGPLTSTMPNEMNEYNSSQINLENKNREFHEKFESTDPNSHNAITYSHYNPFIATTKHNIETGFSGLIDLARDGLNWVAGEKLSSQDQKVRGIYLMNRLINECDLTPEQAAGVVANIYQESRFKATAYNAKDGKDGLPSGGIAQWHGKRLRDIQNYFGGKDITKIPFEDQVSYLIKELRGEVGAGIQNRPGSGVEMIENDSLKSLFSRYKGMNAAEAAVAFERLFEGSADYNNNGDRNRIGFANQFIDAFKNVSSEDIQHIAEGVKNDGVFGHRYNNVYRGRKGYDYGGDNDSTSRYYSSIIRPNQLNVSNASNMVYWIGDSHSLSGGFTLPKKALSYVKIAHQTEVRYAAKSGLTTKDLLNDSTSLKTPNGNETIADIKGKAPAIFIFQLGDKDALTDTSGGISNIQEVFEAFSTECNTLIWITPWGYSRHKSPQFKADNTINDKISEFVYGLIDTFGGITIDISKELGFLTIHSNPSIWDSFIGNDGYLWTKEGYEILGEYLGCMLSGTPISKEFLDKIHKKSEILSKVENLLTNAVDFSNKVLDNIDPSKKADNSNVLLDSSGNYKGLNTLKNYSDAIMSNAVINRQVLIDQGFQTDSSGNMYRETTIGSNTYRGYVNPEAVDYRAVGKSDFTAVQKLDENGNYNAVDASSSEYENATSAIVLDVNNVVFDFEPSKSSNKKPFSVGGKTFPLYLGYFTDIQGYHERLIYDIGIECKELGHKTLKEGNETTSDPNNPGVFFIVQMTEDLREVYSIQIYHNIRCSLIGSDLSYYADPEDNCIFRAGEIWIFKNQPEFNKQFDISKHRGYYPLSWLHNFKLTPKALEALREVTVSLSNLKSLKESSTDSPETLNISTEYTTKDGGRGTLSTGSLNTIANSLMENGFDETGRTQLGIAVKNVNKTGFEYKFTEESYFGAIEGFKGVENYYNSHKNIFTVIDGKLVKADGTVWGEVDSNGKITFKNKKDITRISSADLRKNRRKALDAISQKDAKERGYIREQELSKLHLGIGSKAADSNVNHWFAKLINYGSFTVEARYSVNSTSGQVDNIRIIDIFAGDEKNRISLINPKIKFKLFKSTQSSSAIDQFNEFIENHKDEIHLDRGSLEDSFNSNQSWSGEIDSGFFSNDYPPTLEDIIPALKRVFPRVKVQEIRVKEGVLQALEVGGKTYRPLDDRDDYAQISDDVRTVAISIHNDYIDRIKEKEFNSNVNLGAVKETITSQFNKYKESKFKGLKKKDLGDGKFLIYDEYNKPIAVGSKDTSGKETYSSLADDKNSKLLYNTYKDLSMLTGEDQSLVFRKAYEEDSDFRRLEGFNGYYKEIGGKRYVGASTDGGIVYREVTNGNVSANLDEISTNKTLYQVDGNGKMVAIDKNEKYTEAIQKALEMALDYLDTDKLQAEKAFQAQVNEARTADENAKIQITNAVNTWKENQKQTILQEEMLKKQLGLTDEGWNAWKTGRFNEIEQQAVLKVSDQMFARRKAIGGGDYAALEQLHDSGINDIGRQDGNWVYGWTKMTTADGKLKVQNGKQWYKATKIDPATGRRSYVHFLGSTNQQEMEAKLRSDANKAAKTVMSNIGNHNGDNITTNNYYGSDQSSQPANGGATPETVNGASALPAQPWQS